MPPRGSVMTATEVLLAREACEPLLASITDRLLRSGLAGFAEFRRRYATACQRAVSASGDTKKTTTTTITQAAQPPPSSASSSRLSSRATRTAAKDGEAAPRVARRINPEGLKSVFAEAGVLFSPEEFRSVLIAYSDAVGFVLADDLLADLHPCRSAPLDLIRACTAAVAGGLFAELPMLPSTGGSGGSGGGGSGGGGSGGGGSDADFAAVTVGSVQEVLSAVFDPALSTEEEEKMAAAKSSCASALASIQADVEATFTDTVYPDGAVPAEDVVAFVVLALQQHATVAVLVLARLREAPPLAAAPSPDALATTMTAATGRRAGATSGLDGSALFSIHHTGATTQRKFEYYGDNVDRRDEWVRGRQEADARPAYQRHTVGYGGHLPEYQYRFGRTFHVIEEDLPQLTKPKAPLEPVPAAWYGEGVELKDSRMNAHHYRLA